MGPGSSVWGRIKILCCLLFLYLPSLRAQDHPPEISIAFEQATLATVFELIEEKADLRFYYITDWLGDEKVSGNFTDATLSAILTELLKDTQLNFYLLDGDKVILTQHTIIYDDLPAGFFGQKDSSIVIDAASVQKSAINPVFYSPENSSDRTIMETVMIGKADANNTSLNYRLEGYVRNRNTGEPIPDLSILLLGKGIGTVTDAKGYYAIDLSAGSNRLRTSSMGIQSSEREVVIYNNGILDFDLSESLEQLEEVVVQADAAKNVEQANTGTTQIDSEASKNIPLVLGERDVLRVATTLPGITTAGEGATGFNVRGGKTDQNLILLDDAVIYNPTHFFGIFPAINPFTTRGVAIYKGNIPAEYGGRLSSVFDIESKKGNVEKFAGEASIGPVTANVALEIPIEKDKSSLILGGRGAYTDWILRSLDEESLKNSNASFYDGIIKYDHHLNTDNDLGATAYYSRDAFSITSDSLYKYSNRGFSLHWDRKINEKNTGTILLANSQYRFNIAYDGRSNNDFALGYQIDETELKLKLIKLYNEHHTFAYGVSAKYYRVNPGEISPEGPNSIVLERSIAKESALESALFLSDELKVNDRLVFDLGLRYAFFAALGPSEQRIYAEGLPRNAENLIDTKEYGSNAVIKTYGGAEVRTSARYFLRPDLSLKASFNNGYQFIHTLSNNTTVSPIDTWKLSDTNIKPQRGNQFSLGIYQNLKENEYEISLEGYYKSANNVLDFKTGAQILLNETLETEVLQGEGKSYGVEFLLRKNKGRLNGWLGYTYSRSLIKFDSEFNEERINNGKYFPSNFDKPHDISLIANYKFTRRYSVSANFVYQTGRPVTFPIGTYQFNNAEYVYFSNRNAFRIPDFYRLDVGINIEGNHKIKKFAHSFWTISVYNVLGRNNPYSVFFVTEGGEVKALQSSIFAIPIPSITYNFKF